MSRKHILFIEAFYGGSHKQLIDLICGLFPSNSEIYTMLPKKWHWRNICSGLHFANIIPNNHDFKILFTSSVLPLSQLLALRPDLQKLHKIVYFHENQLLYPTREEKARYYQHGLNDILSCLVADQIIFNSTFNRDSFISSISPYLNKMPDYKPKDIENQISVKCSVLPFPINLPLDITNKESKEYKLHIVWPHRWEHDKDPETFFSVMFRLKDSKQDFYLSVIGEIFSEKPGIFEEARKYLEENILNWGYKSCKQEYYKVLQSADVVVSTAIHEFFGVSMLEATSLNCYPLCPNRLAYPELYGDKYLYNTPNQLFKRLKYFCQHPNAARHHQINIDVSKFSWQNLRSRYLELFRTESANDEESSRIHVISEN